MTVVENKWLQGPYAPIPGDVTATELEVLGTLPVELEGRYLRNGPNPISPVDRTTHHWFVGDAMVHGIRLGGGTADWYHARMVRSTAVSDALGEAPAPGERHGGMDTVNTNVIALAGKTYAIVEAGARPVELSYELDTIEHSDFGGGLPHGYTAHPKVDPATGDLHAIAYHWALPHLEYIVIGPQGVCEEARVSATHLGRWLDHEPTLAKLEWRNAIFFPWDPVARRFRGEVVYTDLALR